MAETNTLPVSSIFLRDEIRAMLNSSARWSLGMISAVQDWYWSDIFAKLHSKSTCECGAICTFLVRTKKNSVIYLCNVFYPSQAKFDSTVLLNLVIVTNLVLD